MSQQPVTAPDALAFADRRVDGAYPVTAPDGAVVARISVNRWSGRSFEAETHEGAPLCSGRQRGWFSNSWDAVDAAGTPIVSVRQGFWGRRRTFRLADGPELVLSGRMLSRDWELTDSSGRVVLGGDALGSSFSFHPDGVVVRVYDPALTLAQVVAIVELNRLIVKAGRNTAAASSS